MPIPGPYGLRAVRGNRLLRWLLTSLGHALVMSPVAAGAGRRFDQGQSRVNLSAVPPGPVLILEQDDVAVRRDARVAPQSMPLDMLDACAAGC